ncbi:MAG: flagellin lysine-N-methylase [Lachnospiraceae bacterium]|nr:flagellin lysine-N-methylase [Lachnospiraceae bacterium]
MKTTIRTSVLYDRFSCLGADCPQNCCYGWKIPVDEESEEKYRRERSITGLRACLAVHGRENRLFNRLTLRCPMLDPDGLCALQKKRGEGFLPAVCRVYPREWANLGTFVERTLDLSCIHAAEIYLEAASEPDGGLAMREETGLWEEPRSGTNDDPEFLEELTGRREEILAGLMDGGIATAEDFDTYLYGLADAQKRRQDEILRVEAHGVNRIRMFPFSVMLLNELMSTSFYEDHLRLRAPGLYRMCRRYYKMFDRLSEIEGQKKLDAMFARFLTEEDGIPVQDYVRYFAYCLQRTFFATYEDYSLLRRVEEALVHVNVLLLLETLAREAGVPMTVRERASMISAYEKRVFHNSDVLRAMVKCVTDRLV